MHPTSMNCKAIGAHFLVAVEVLFMSTASGSSIGFHFYCHFLVAVEVAVEVAVNCKAIGAHLEGGGSVSTATFFSTATFYSTATSTTRRVLEDFPIELCYREEINFDSNENSRLVTFPTITACHHSHHSLRT